ncbi:T9SS type A sorting domain-containing protein [Chryseobacterium shigense]|uniref:Por secretion system C-terminal sorting domain-containing protein n=1 Tax=Chryseobacterium shigense TaxID=297244 RepID=A0A841N4S6_9FLAO|nr:T9SS type A sorting domain-containing protein [Chryseobacterium shigense]MBB6369741.1 hypothetical protein [Chryseobacterium shigense]
MRKLSTLLLGLAAPFFFAQQAGDLVNFEKKLDLTPQGVADFIANNLGEQNAPDFVSYLNGFNVGLKGYKITYYTKNEKNALVKATGLIMYPNVDFKLSTVISDHPTTDSRQNVPSNLKGIFWFGFVMELSYALNGYVVMAPDYVGMGTGDGVHPYVNSLTEGGATVDFVKAANTVLAQLNVKRYDEYFLTGYSQGGHAAMSTLKYLSTNNPNNLKIKYAFMGDGPYDLSGVTLNEGFLQTTVYPATAFLGYILNSCQSAGYNIYTNNVSEVISSDYLAAYDNHVAQDNGGILWGPFIWRNMFTPSFVTNLTNNQNANTRKCLKANNVSDWYNKTPTTMGTSTIDLIVPPNNTYNTVNAQRAHYPWYDLNKYNINSLSWGPLGHVGGPVPYVLAANAKFNSLRSGGFFNQWAFLTSKQAENNQPKTDNLFSSQLKPDLKNMELVQVTDFNQEKSERKSLVNNNLSTLKDGVYLLKVQENNNEKLIPYIKNTPVEVPENEIVQSESNGILKLRIPQEELLSVNIFDENKNLLKTVSQEQYSENGGINLTDIDNQNNTFEVVTQFYNLQFKKATADGLLANKAEIFTQDRQINARANNGIKNISIYSISGALILQQEINKPEFKSNNLESGVYVVQMSTADGKTVSKKVKL